MPRFVSKCKSCGQEIVFLPRVGRDGKPLLKPDGKQKYMPCQPDSVRADDTQYDRRYHKSHFDVCPAAEEWRKSEPPKQGDDLVPF